MWNTDLTLGNLAVLIQQFSVNNFNTFTVNVTLVTTMFLHPTNPYNFTDSMCNKINLLEQSGHGSC